MVFVVKPGRNATLRDAWEALYGKPKKASNAKAKPEVAPAPPAAKKAAKKARRKAGARK